MKDDKKKTEVAEIRDIDLELSDKDLEKVSGGVSETDDVAELLRTAFVWRSANDD